MTYDFHGSWETQTGMCAPLYAGSSDSSAYQRTLNVSSAVQDWISNGASRSKLIVGIATYGRTFTLQNANQNTPGSPSCGAGQAPPHGEEGIMTYNQVCIWDKMPIKCHGTSN
jgi:chitinase